MSFVEWVDATVPLRALAASALHNSLFEFHGTHLHSKAKIVLGRKSHRVPCQVGKPFLNTTKVWLLPSARRSMSCKCDASDFVFRCEAQKKPAPTNRTLSLNETHLIESSVQFLQHGEKRTSDQRISKIHPVSSGVSCSQAAQLAFSRNRRSSRNRPPSGQPPSGHDAGKITQTPCANPVLHRTAARRMANSSLISASEVTVCAISS